MDPTQNVHQQYLAPPIPAPLTGYVQPTSRAAHYRYSIHAEAIASSIVGSLLVFLLVLTLFQCGPAVWVVLILVWAAYWSLGALTPFALEAVWHDYYRGAEGGGPTVEEYRALRSLAIAGWPIAWPATGWALIVLILRGAHPKVW